MNVLQFWNEKMVYTVYDHDIRLEGNDEYDYIYVFTYINTVYIYIFLLWYCAVNMFVIHSAYIVT